MSALCQYRTFVKCISGDHNPTRLQLDEVCKDLVEVTIIAGVEDIELSPRQYGL